MLKTQSDPGWGSLIGAEGAQEVYTMVKDAVCGVDEAGWGHFCCPHCGMDRCIAVAEKILIRNRFNDTCVGFRAPKNGSSPLCQ